MRVLLCFCLLMACFGTPGARPRTVRRNIDLQDDEKKFIKEFDTFLDESEGIASKDHWTSSDVKPLETFGLMQKAFISDMVLQTCIVSGVYLRQEKGHTPTTTRTEKLVSRLLNLLRTKRSTDAPMTTGMDWEKDPLNLLEDAESQFRNLCFTLFDLRRLNRKLAAAGQESTTQMV
ncbi:uncharacterized protein LOC124268263 [Haliotis rubra]|uniref:uncharacterized protein LOC124268263 n=1 Tax=Haliotis rubra TaxID=36100 RepID=UPI001EE5499D|nr:uncharacterized protein LOC124268263 [Haliotis rubra]